MTLPTVECLLTKKCVPCEGGVPPVSRQDAEERLVDLPGWQLTDDGVRIRHEWELKNFVAAMEFFNQVTALAEADGHHPDLHLVRYRQVAIELWTHAIGGLSENDFILAAKINRLPVRLRTT